MNLIIKIFFLNFLIFSFNIAALAAADLAAAALKPSALKPSALKPSALKPSALKPSALKSSVSLDIRIVIPHVTKVNFINHYDSLIISSEDIKRGYIEIEKSMEIINNSLTGVNMCIHYDPHVLSGLKINFNENSFNILNEETCHLLFLGKVFKQFSIKYHFLLNGDLPEGVYAWPVNIVLTPYNF